MRDIFDISGTRIEIEFADLLCKKWENYLQTNFNDENFNYFTLIKSFKNENLCEKILKNAASDSMHKFNYGGNTWLQLRQISETSSSIYEEIGDL